MVSYSLNNFGNFFRKYPTDEGERYFWEARYITATFDASPNALKEATRVMKTDAGVLRVFTTKLQNALDVCQGHTYRNPFLNVPKETQANK